MELPFFTIAICVLLFIGLIIGFVKGVKRGFYSLVSNIISIVAAFGITRIIIIVLSKRGLTPIGDKILGNTIFHDITDVEALNYTPKFIATVCLSLVLFYAFYIVFLIITQIVKRKIFNKVTKVSYSKYNVLLEKKWYMKILAILIGFVSCATTCYVLTFGIVAVNDAILKGFEESDKISTPYVCKKIKDNYAYNVISKCKAKEVFDGLTKMHDSNVNTTTTNEITKGIKTVVALDNVANNNEVEKNLDILGDCITTTDIVPEIAAQIVIDRANEVKVEEPKKNEKGMDARFSRLKNELLIFAKSSNKDNIKENAKTAVNIGKKVFEKDLEKISTYKEVMDTLKDESFVEDIFVELYNNKNTQNIMGYLIDLCVGSVFDSINVDIKETYIFSLDYSKLSLSEVKKEANIISLFAKDYEIIQKLSKAEMLAEEEMKQIKEDLKNIEKCEIITTTVYDTINGYIKNLELVETPTLPVTE